VVWLADFDKLQQAITVACEEASKAALNSAILFAVAFIVFAGASFLAYKKYSASKSRMWLAALIISALITFLSLVVATMNFVAYSNMECY
jgi:uncharacterized membrane protein